jgi:hypothetical protein
MSASPSGRRLASGTAASLSGAAAALEDAPAPLDDVGALEERQEAASFLTFAAFSWCLAIAQSRQHSSTVRAISSSTLLPEICDLG